MIDGSQAFVVYFIVGHHFILTIHDADGFCQDPEFRRKLVCFCFIFLIIIWLCSCIYLTIQLFLISLTCQCLLESEFWKKARPFSLISSDFRFKCPPFALVSTVIFFSVYIKFLLWILISNITLWGCLTGAGCRKGYKGWRRWCFSIWYECWTW